MSSRKQLFLVTLDWNSNDRELGDYATTVWAGTGAAALHRVAEELAWHPDGCCATARERNDYIARLIGNAGPYAVECVVDSVLAHLRELMDGPGKDSAARREADYLKILVILAHYGVRLR